MTRIPRRRPQDSAAAYPAYAVTYRRQAAASPPWDLPAAAGADSLMGRGEALVRAHLEALFGASADADALSAPAAPAPPDAHAGAPSVAAEDAGSAAGGAPGDFLA